MTRSRRPLAVWLAMGLWPALPGLQADRNYSFTPKMRLTFGLCQESAGDRGSAALNLLAARTRYTEG